MQARKYKDKGIDFIYLNKYKTKRCSLEYYMF